MHYQSNKQSILRDRYVKSNAIKLLLLCPLMLIILTILSYISMSKWIVFFYAIVPLQILLLLGLLLYATMKMINIHNRTICSIQLDETNIGIKTFAALWKKPMEWNLSVMQMSVKRSKFQWYGKGEKHGLTIKYKGKEFYLVAEYFDNFEKIQQELC